MSEVLSVFVNSTSGLIVLAILAFNTIRDVVAYMGVVPRETKFIGRILYGKYDEDLVAHSLIKLGYSFKEAREKQKKLKECIKDMEGTTAVTKENAPIHLILLLAKYIVEFKTPIRYGGKTESYYYINTMEIVHDREDSRILCEIMIRLFYSIEEEDINAVFVPKSGNPLFAERVAERLNIPSVFIKDNKEKSKLHSENEKNVYQINFEGISKIKNECENIRCPIIDCNVSGGSQMQTAIKEVNREGLNAKITEAYILFRVDDKEHDIESAFHNLNVNLYRYFDLDEEVKKDIYQINKLAKDECRSIEIANKNDYERAQNIVNKLKNEDRFYYNVKKNS